MKNILKKARKDKGMLIRDVASQLGVDSSLVSRFESGDRIPSQQQALKLAEVLEINSRDLLVAVVAQNVMKSYALDDITLEGLKVAEEQIKYNLLSKKNHPSFLQELLDEIDDYRSKLNELRAYDSYRITQALELEYTYESNKIEGNTLTLQETDLVINEGITLSGKSMREHLEAVNHTEAITYLKELVKRKTDFKERDILQLHYLVLKGIDSNYAGKYRNVQVMIKGSKHMPPQPFLVKKQMEDLFYWYEGSKNSLHPVVLAAEFSERLVTIHPFIDGNGRTSRLIMNLILLRNGYTIANIKGDHDTRMSYYTALEKAQVDNDKLTFHVFAAQTELACLKRYIQILGG